MVTFNDVRQGIIHFVRYFLQTLSSVRFHTTQHLPVTAVISFSWSTTSSFNSQKYIDILDTYLWPVIARHFPTDEYLLQDENAPLYVSRETKRWKQENNNYKSEQLHLITY
jgi:hypothetical protein